jgi:hypothetical protein
MMETVKETKAKKAAPKPNGQSKTTAQPLEKPKAQEPKKDTVWALARTLLDQGKKDEEIKKAAYDRLVKTLDPQKALEQWSARLAYRALFRAKKAAKSGKGKGHATK